MNFDYLMYYHLMTGLYTVYPVAFDFALFDFDRIHYIA